MKKLQLTFNKKYISSTRIGLGQHTEVYLGYQISTEKQIAVKLQKVDSENANLEKEAKFYRIVNGGVGIANFYWYGVQNNYRALVIDNLGPSLQQLLKYCKGTFTLKTVLLIADQMLQRIQWVHSKGLIYNNIDPNNFVVGLGQKQDKIYLIDFGSCQKYLNQHNNHCQFQTETSSLKFNLRFKSVMAHIHKKTGRRDDIQSLGYMLVYFLKGKLPWDDLEGQEITDLTIKEVKVSVPLHILCEGLPQQFVKYFEYVRSLQYEQQPNYVWVGRLLRDLFDRNGFIDNKVLDWAQKHKY